MSYININNPLGIKDFETMLDTYEASCVFHQMDFAKKRSLSLMLKSALERLILSYPIDSLRMLSILAHRVIKNKNCAYSPKTLLDMAEIASRVGGSPLIIAIPYAFHKAMLGQLPEFDQTWFSLMNGNPVIQLYLQNLNNSVFAKYANVNSTDILEWIEEPNHVTNKDTDVNILVNSIPTSLNLTSLSRQTVGVTLLDGLQINETTSAIHTFFEVECGVKSFSINSHLNIDPTVKAYFNSMAGESQLLTDGSFRNFTIPKPFYKYRFYIDSFDKGLSWTISSFEINHI